MIGVLRGLYQFALLQPTDNTVHIAGLDFQQPTQAVL
jgi:hypothetical protein